MPAAANARIKLSYSSGDDQGAVCWLPEVGVLTQVESSEALKKYVKDNIEGWYEEIRKAVSIKLEDLIFVNGSIKSTYYRIVTILSGQRSRAADIGAGVPSIIDFGLHIRLVTDNDSRSKERSILPGERQLFPDKGLSMFLRYYRMTSRLGFWKTLKANAGPHSLPPGEDPSDDVAVRSLVDERDSEDSATTVGALVKRPI